MATRLIGAGMRAFLVWLLITTPSLLLSGPAGEESPMIVLIAIIAAFFTFTEYYSNYPSIIEFRFAAPFNRLRFLMIFAMIISLSLVCKGKADPTELTMIVKHWGDMIGETFDQPFSPVRLVILMLHDQAHPELVASVRTAAGLSYAISLVALATFILIVRVAKWPSRNGAFNVWVNLPLFDPTGGGDVLVRLKRDASVNIFFGFLLPFLIPAVVKGATDLTGTLTMSDPQTLIWTMSAWAFLPASMIMRGIAMGRVAEMIEEKRRRAYAQSEAAQAA
ncbi:MAG: hypothetical protein AAF891_01090 [Pseudomonadota bacterium]